MKRKRLIKKKKKRNLHTAPNSRYVRWISSPAASARQLSASTDCRDGRWGGGRWAECGSNWSGWLPHLVDQSNKQNVPAAVPKIRQVRLRAVAPWPAHSVMWSPRRCSSEPRDSFGRPLDASSGCQSRTDVMALSSACLCKEPNGKMQPCNARRLRAHWHCSLGIFLAPVSSQLR